MDQPPCSPRAAHRRRCRQFPSLINCCTIDWFSAWPKDALLSVSRRFLETQDLGSEAVNRAVSEMCVDIHLGVSDMADKFYQELRRRCDIASTCSRVLRCVSLARFESRGARDRIEQRPGCGSDACAALLRARRRYYVTPKSYLDLIHLYVTLLRTKRQEMAMARDRLLNGLAKLQETNVVVDKMQRELEELQPVLAQKTIDTQRLLVQVSPRPPRHAAPRSDCPLQPLSPDSKGARAASCALARDAQVAAEGKDAEAVKRSVAAEEEEVKKKQAETQVLKNDAQKDLEEVSGWTSGPRCVLRHWPQARARSTRLCMVLSPP